MHYLDDLCTEVIEHTAKSLMVHMPFKPKIFSFPKAIIDGSETPPHVDSKGYPASA